MITVFYGSDTNDAVAKKKNKKIAEAAKNTIKEYGHVEVFSSKTNRIEGLIKDKENIIPYWGGVSFELDDEIDPSLCEVRGIVKEIVMGKIPDSKHPEQAIDGIERLII